MSVKLINGYMDAFFLVQIYFYTDDFCGKQNFKYKMAPLSLLPLITLLPWLC